MTKKMHKRQDVVSLRPLRVLNTTIRRYFIPSINEETYQKSDMDKIAAIDGILSKLNIPIVRFEKKISRGVYPYESLISKSTIEEILTSDLIIRNKTKEMLNLILSASDNAEGGQNDKPLPVVEEKKSKEVKSEEPNKTREVFNQIIKLMDEINLVRMELLPDGVFFRFADFIGLKNWKDIQFTRNSGRFNRRLEFIKKD